MDDKLIEAVAKVLAEESCEKWDAKDFTETTGGDDPQEMRDSFLYMAEKAITAHNAYLADKGMLVVEPAPIMAALEMMAAYSDVAESEYLMVLDNAQHAMIQAALEQTTKQR